MADSEASGEARLDDPVDDPVDMDRSAIGSRGDAQEPAADSEFEYLFNDPDYEDPAGDHNGNPATAPVTCVDREWLEPAPPTEEEERSFDAFDAFNASTWNFKPSATPWYQTRQSLTVMVAVSIAVVALVVSVVLLAFNRPPDDGNSPATDTSAAPTTATATATSTEAAPPPPPPPSPPPPPGPTASEINPPPVYNQRPQQQQQPTKKPEINVTRSPLSVRPQMPTKHQ